MAATSTIVVPRGKRVYFNQGGAPIKNTEDAIFILEEPLTLSLNSTFTPLVGGGAPKAFTVLSGITRDVVNFSFSGQWKQLGYMVWERTDPLSTTFTLSLKMRTNALADVVMPAKALMKLPLPEETGGGGVKGLGLVPPGPSVLDALNGGGEEGSATGGRLITCRIGFVRLPGVVVKRVEPTVSEECDSEGNPVWIKLVVDISTIFTATSKLIDGFAAGSL